jgi:hypothetical protein
LLVGAFAVALIRRNPPEPEAESRITLDSFSEESVAKAVLEQKVEQLRVQLLTAWRDYHILCAAYDWQYRQWLQRKGQTDTAHYRQQFAQQVGPRPQMNVDQWTQRYRQTMEHLRLEHALQLLEHDLFLLYHHNQRWREWMELYVEILQRNPGQYNLSLHGTEALLRSEQYGNTAQIHEALQHIATYSTNPVNSAVARHVLNRWQQSTSSPESDAHQTQLTLTGSRASD